MTITEVAERIGVTPKTIARWEKSGKIKKPKRDWRDWRAYSMEDFKKIQSFKETLIGEEENTEEKVKYAQSHA
jgi:DNA-binding transcriptional MerR regulator